MGMDFLNGRKTWFLLAGILTIGGFLRFHALDRQSLWDDEMGTIQRIQSDLPTAVRHLRTDAHPPLYFLQLRAWQTVTGRSLKMLRANSAWWGSLSLLFLYWLLHLYGREGVGVLAVGWMALSPFHLAYSQELRPYALAIAEVLLGFIILEYDLRKPGSWRRNVCLWAIWVAELYTHYWAAFVFIAQGVYGLSRNTDPRDRKRLWTIGILALLAFIPWLPILHDQIRVDSTLAFWSDRPTPINLAKTFIAYTGLYFHFASGAFSVPVSRAIIILASIVYAGLLGLGWRKGPPFAKEWLLLGLLTPSLLSYWKPSIYVWYRYTSIIYPAFIILCAVGAVSARPRWLGGVLVAFLFTLEVWADGYYFTQWQKANPQAVVQYVNTLKTSGAIVVKPFYFSDLYRYYDQERPDVTVIEEHTLDSYGKRTKLRGHPIIFIKFDAAEDEVGAALIHERHVQSARYFPGYAHLGVTVYELR